VRETPGEARKDRKLDFLGGVSERQETGPMVPRFPDPEKCFFCDEYPKEKKNGQRTPQTVAGVGGPGNQGGSGEKFLGPDHRLGGP